VEEVPNNNSSGVPNINLPSLRPLKSLASKLTETETGGGGSNNFLSVKGRRNMNMSIGLELNN
jgi:hypothetical protein